MVARIRSDHLVFPDMVAIITTAVTLLLELNVYGAYACAPKRQVIRTVLQAVFPYHLGAYALQIPSGVFNSEWVQ